MAWAYLDVDALSAYLNDTTTRNTDQMRRALEAVSRQVDDYCKRQFQPYQAVMDYTADDPCELMIDDLLTATAVHQDMDGDRTYETTMSTTDWELEPWNATQDERPYRAIVTTPQTHYLWTRMRRGVRIGGTWGYWSKTQNSTVTLSTSAALNATSTNFVTSAAPDLHAGNTVLMDSEQMYINSLSGTTVNVDRALNGTTAASHSTGTAIAIYKYPAVVVEATRLQATRLFKRKDAPLGSFVGPSDMIENVVETQRLDPDSEKLLENYRRKTWLAV